MSQIIELFQVTDSKRGYAHVTLKGTCSEHVTDPAIQHYAAKWAGYEGLPFGFRDYIRSQDKKSWAITIHTD